MRLAERHIAQRALREKPISNRARIWNARSQKRSRSSHEFWIWETKPQHCGNALGALRIWRAPKPFMRIFPLLSQQMGKRVSRQVRYGLRRAPNSLSRKHNFVCGCRARWKAGRAASGGTPRQDGQFPSCGTPRQPVTQHLQALDLRSIIRYFHFYRIIGGFPCNPIMSSARSLLWRRNIGSPRSGCWCRLARKAFLRACWPTGSAFLRHQ